MKTRYFYMFLTSVILLSFMITACASPPKEPEVSKEVSKEAEQEPQPEPEPKPEPEPEPEVKKEKTKRFGIETTELERGPMLNVQPVLFGYKSAVLTTVHYRTLKKIASQLREFPEYKIAVEGHASYRGPARGNVKLSRKRAAAVARMLRRYGVDSERIIHRGLGETRPVHSSRTRYAKNRQVTFILLRDAAAVEKYRKALKGYNIYRDYQY